MVEITGVILAGGRGVRLRPLTAEADSSTLLTVQGEPSWSAYPAIRQPSRGITRLLLVIDKLHTSEFVTILRDGRELGLASIGYVWQPAGGRGMPSAIGMVEHLLPTEKFMVACGDVLTDADLATPLDQFRAQRDGARMVGV